MEKNYKILKFKNREEWLLKGRKIGGSSASSIIRLNKWQSAIDTWSNFFNKKITPPNETQEYGNLCEGPIREIARINFLQWGWETIPPNFKHIEMAVKSDKTFISATIDGTIEVKEEGKSPFGYKGRGILEIKTKVIKSQKDLEEWDGQLPQNYLIQVLHYLMVYNDYNFAVLVAKLRFEKEINEKRTFDHEEIRYYYIDRKDFEERIKWLEKKETEFYEKYLKGDEIPAF